MQRKKVGIITITGTDNYGNRLQNFALQKILENNNYDVETIWRQKESQKNLIYKIYLFKEWIFKQIKSIKQKTNIIKLEKEREKLFKKFNEEYIVTSNYSSKGIIPHEVSDMYDYFITGSDQVWNYKYVTMNTNDFLAFADYDKTISYAPSFGVSEISPKWENFYKENLSHIKHMSVREKQGKKIVANLTKRKIPVVLDPTLLLNKNDYFKIAKKPKNFTSKKYLLVYFLGAIDSETQSEILKVAKENDLEIVSLMGLNNSHYYTSGPSEFVYLFKEASLIFTDSFHGTVFSMIFEKPFFVFERKGRIKMNSRIESILNILKLQERKISSVSEVKDLFDTDYKKAKELLNKERKKSIDFLKEALHNYSFNGDYNE